MSWIGDVNVGSTIDMSFTSVASTGVPTALTAASIGIVKDNGTTLLSSAITLSTDFASVTGLNHIRISTSTALGDYTSGSEYQAIITAGTVAGQSVVGYTIDSFSILNRPLNWGNVVNPTSTVNLTATTVQTVNDVVTVTGNVDGTVASVVGNVGGDVQGNVDGNVGGSVASVTGNVGGSVASVTGNVGGSVASVTGNVGGNLGGDVQGNVDGSVASVTGSVGGDLTGDVQGNVDGSVASVTGNVGGSVATVTSLGVNAVGSVSISQVAYNQIADEIDARDWTANPLTIASRSNRNALRRIRNRVSTSGASGIVYEEDDSTTAYTLALTTTAAVSITEVDPS